MTKVHNKITGNVEIQTVIFTIRVVLNWFRTWILFQTTYVVAQFTY